MSMIQLCRAALTKINYLNFSSSLMPILIAAPPNKVNHNGNNLQIELHT